MPKHAVIICNKCNCPDFDYDSLWKEYYCSNCGWIVEEEEKISLIRKQQKERAGISSPEIANETIIKETVHSPKPVATKQEEKRTADSSKPVATKQDGYLKTCPNCNSRTFQGRNSCLYCGYDFITKSVPNGDLFDEQELEARNKRLSKIEYNVFREFTISMRKRKKADWNKNYEEIVDEEINNYTEEDRKLAMTTKLSWHINISTS